MQRSDDTNKQQPFGAEEPQSGRYRSAGILDGMDVVIVGGSSGMGLAAGVAAAAAGATVTLLARRTDRIRRASNLPSGIDLVSVDATDGPALDNFFSHRPPVDHLVYTAADAADTGRITQLAIEEVRRAFQIRYFGLVTTLHAAVPHIRPTGSITLTSGAAAVRPGPESGTLASICAAVEGLARALAVELAPIRVNVVRPGFTRTGLWDNLDEGRREDFFQQAARSNLLRRIGEPPELGAAYLYAMTQTYATGSVFACDGGYALT